MNDEDKSPLFWAYHVICFLSYSILAIMMGVFCPIFIGQAVLWLQIFIGLQIFVLFLCFHVVIFQVQARNHILWHMRILQRLYEHNQAQVSQLQGRMMIMSEQVADVGSPVGQGAAVGPRDKFMLQDPFPMDLEDFAHEQTPKFLSPDDLLKRGKSKKKTKLLKKVDPLVSHNPSLSPAIVMKKEGGQDNQAREDAFAWLHDTWDTDEEKIEQTCHVSLWRDSDGDIAWYLQQALEKDLVQIYIQPIVVLPQRRRRFFECYHWIKTEDGKIILPRYYTKAAHDFGILTQMDQALLEKCLLLLQQLHRYDQMLAFVCNIHPLSFKDHAFWQEFILRFSQTPALAGKLVLEISQELFNAHKEALVPLFKQAGKVGILFSLDHVTTIDKSLCELGGYSFCFVKIEGDLLLDYISTDQGYQSFISLRDTLLSKGVYIVASKIESEGPLVELLDYGIQYAQGFLLGEPRLSKLQPLAEKED